MKDIILISLLLIGLFFYGETSRKKEELKQLQVQIESQQLQLKSQDKTIDDLITQVENLNNELKDFKNKFKTLSVSSYNATKAQCGNDKGITASGNKVKEGQIAVSRKMNKEGWDFGKRVWVQGEGIYEITDLMASRIPLGVDIYKKKVKDSKAFGKKDLLVVLLD